MKQSMIVCHITLNPRPTEKLLLMWLGDRTSLWFCSALFLCVYTKFNVERALKRIGHNGMVAELLRLILLPNPHHRNTSSEDCKHQCRLSLQTVSAEVSFPDLALSYIVFSL